MDDMWYLASNGDYVKGNCWICFVYARDKIEALKNACECVEKKIAERGETHATD